MQKLVKDYGNELISMLAKRIWLFKLEANEVLISFGKDG